MTHSTDPKLIEFLTGPENVRCVLEVLKHGEAVRDTLARRFWSELERHLSATAPSSIGKKFKWRSESWPEGKKTYACLDARLAQFTDEAQSLFYRVEYYAWPQGLQLYYGLHWQEEISPSNTIFSTVPLRDLRQLLEKDGYDMSESEWWLGWKFIHNFTSPEHLLSDFVENPKLLLGTIAEDLWPFVKRTDKHVERANRSLKA